MKKSLPLWNFQDGRDFLCTGFYSFHFRRRVLCEFGHIFPIALREQRHAAFFIVPWADFHSVVKGAPQSTKFSFFLVGQCSAKIIHRDYGGLVGAVDESGMMLLVVNQDVLLGKALGEVRCEKRQHEILRPDGRDEDALLIGEANEAFQKVRLME